MDAVNYKKIMAGKAKSIEANGKMYARSARRSSIWRKPEKSMRRCSI